MSGRQLTYQSFTASMQASFFKVGGRTHKKNLDRKKKKSTCTLMVVQKSGLHSGSTIQYLSTSDSKEKSHLKPVNKVLVMTKTITTCLHTYCIHYVAIAKTGAKRDNSRDFFPIISITVCFIKQLTKGQNVCIYIMLM